jgi:hypothetical protein
MVMTTVRKRLAAYYLMSLHGDDYCAADAAFRAPQLKVAITRWLHLYQKEGLCQEENITARI